MTSFDGLGMIPIDILKQGSQKIVQYMLDLFRSPDADPLYRTKLMVVGFESVGKTTILDCLFPLEGWIEPGYAQEDPILDQIARKVFVEV